MAALPCVLGIRGTPAGLAPGRRMAAGQSHSHERKAKTGVLRMTGISSLRAGLPSKFEDEWQDIAVFLDRPRLPFYWVAHIWI